LLEAGTNYDIFSACALNDFKRVDALLSIDSEAAARVDPCGSTPLHWAVCANAVDCVEKLLDSAVLLNVLNRSKRTAVQWAAERDAVESIQLLARAGVDLNTRDGKGRTPLHRATYEGKVRAAEVLIENGADITLTNDKGKIAFEIARKEAKRFKRKK
jgi:ankyrin repeat protein